MRYFEATFRDPSQLNDWRDTTYIVAASDPALLAEIDSELALPIEQRRHLNGPLATGQGGFNHNGDFWFNWHLLPDQWRFAEFSIELCDGRAYSDVALDTAYWIGTVGQFCGWGYYISKEVQAPSVGTGEPVTSEFLPIVPNPANEAVQINWVLSGRAPVALTVSDMLGSLSVTLPLGQKEAGQHSKEFSTSALSDGVYVATLYVGNDVLSRQFVVQH
jgi:hypothetical protein